MTIVICTKNRPNALANCLTYINRLNYKRKEVIIVDNSTQGFARKVREIVEANKYKYIYESKPGLSIARNASIRASRGKFIAFTDDDCIVDKNWVIRLVKNFSNPQVMCVTGYVISTKGEDEMFEIFFDHSKGPESRVFSIDSSPNNPFSLLKMGTKTTVLREHAPIPWCIGTGNNMAFRRVVFRFVGMFDERLGVGTSQRGGEDMDMFFRIFSHGFTLVYDPKAIIYHDHQHGQSLEALANTFFSYGRGQGSFMVKHLYNWYICSQYFGRFINLGYSILKSLLKKDKVTFYLRYKQFLGMISSISHAFPQ